MKKEIADKWVAALRSGDYKQTKGKLANVDRTEHCCLGVLCEMAIKDGVDVEMDVRHIEAESADEVDVFYTEFDKETGHPPDSVRRWAGMGSPSGRLYQPAYDEDTSLASLNDRNWSFKQIADVIEKHWESF